MSTGSKAVVVCQTCGMPVAVSFDAEGNIASVTAVCGHMTMGDLRVEREKGPHAQVDELAVEALGTPQETPQ